MRSKFLVVFTVLMLSHALAAEGMQFTIQGTGGNCRACSWVLAEGIIDAGTTEKFKAFIAKEKPPRNLRFDSPGGSVIEALKLGQFLREKDWDTFVGEDLYDSQKSSCYSACVYAFAGGVQRTAQDKSVGIHQFYRPDDALRPNERTLSAVDVANMQRLAALLNEYVRQMGVDPRLVTIASNITPWEPIYLLSGAELKFLNLDNTSAPASDASINWSVQPAGNGAIAITLQPQNGAGRIASLGIMCLQSLPDMIVVHLAVRDDTKDWAEAIKSLHLLPQYFLFEINGNYGELDSNRLMSPVKRSGNGVSLDLAITKDELLKIIRAESLEIDAFVSMASERWIGELGGRFSMAGAPAVINLALKNCLSQ
jgi:hypothetical protein